MKKLLLPLFLCAATTLQTNDFLISALELAAMLKPNYQTTEENEEANQHIEKKRLEQKEKEQRIKQEKDELIAAEAERRTREEETKRKAKEEADAIALKETEQEIIERIRKHNEEANRRKEAQREAALTGPTAYQHDPYAQKVVNSEEDLSSLLPTEAIDTENLLPSATPSSPVTPSTPESAFGQQTEKEADLFNDLQTQQQQLDAVQKFKEKTSAKKIQTKYKKYKEEKERLEKAEADRKAQASSSLPSENQSSPSAAATSESAFEQQLEEEEEEVLNDLEEEPQPIAAIKGAKKRFKRVTSAEKKEKARNALAKKIQRFSIQPTKSSSSLSSENQPPSSTSSTSSTPTAVQSTAKPTPKEKTDFETATEFVNTINKTEKLDLYKQAVSNFCAIMFDVNIIDWGWGYGIFNNTRPQFTIKPEISQHTTNAQLTELINNAAETIKDKFSADNNKFKAQQWTFLDSKNRTKESSKISGDYLSTFILESLSPKQESPEPIEDSARSSDLDPDDL